MRGGTEEDEEEVEKESAAGREREDGGKCWSELEVRGDYDDVIPLN